MKGAYALVGFALGVVVCAAGYVAFLRPAASPVGAIPGDTVPFHLNLIAGETVGGRTASSSAVSATPTYVELKDATRYDWTPNLAGLTLTFPASSTVASLVPKAGDTRTFYFCNATSTAATPFTFAVGSGVNLLKATTSTSVAKGGCAMATLLRKANTDIDLFFDLAI